VDDYPSRKMNKISFVISVRNRDRPRILRCVKSLKSPRTKEIIIVDYGSKVPIRKINGTKIIRVETDNIWNKSHALNIGIKAAEGEFIATVDCDIILSKNFLGKIGEFLQDRAFIVSMDVRRINLLKLKGNIQERYLNIFAIPWIDSNRINIYQNHSANGGIQLFSKKWINKVRGYDENLVYWGGMDNDLYERAVSDHQVMINLNEPIYHQEHELKKEQNLEDEEEKARANDIRLEKTKYLEEKLKKKQIIGHMIWGEEDNPQQDYFLNKSREIQEDKEEFIKQIEEAIQHKDHKVSLGNGEAHIFYPNETKKNNCVGTP
jgi:glycosyltransferase involved in cell wall biosynthesis